MTRITNLVIQGFKSFARRTEIPFGKRFNVVLGPNGAGKSNVLDALCFVLGRMSSKSMRAEKSANLIYNGGKSKKPASFALVEIHFDNAKRTFPIQSDTVIISRKLLPTGTSIYKINDRKCTRKEVIDLLSLAKINPDGYNIILQGDIVKFIDMSPEKRRQVIEEISDISVYEDKKQKALLELAKVEEKLKEAHIILTERKTYLDELKDEYNAALKYKNMQDRIESSKATYLYLQIEQKKKKLEELNNKEQKEKQQIQELKTKLDNLYKKKKELEEGIDKINKEVEEKGEKGQVDIHKEIEELKIQANTIKMRIETCKDEIAKINNRRLELKKSNEEILSKTESMRKEAKMMENDRKALESEKEVLLKKIEAFKKKYNLESAGEIDKKIEEIDNEAEKVQSELDSLRAEQQNLIREKDRVEILLNSIDERIKKVKEVEKEHQQELAELKKKKQEFKQITIRINKLITEDSALASKLAGKQKELYDAREELAKVKGREQSIKVQISGNIAVSRVIEANLRGVLGTVSSLGSVQSKFATAVDVAAGGHLRDIVVDTADNAARCIKFLKQRQLGVATFLPLDKLRDIPISAKARELAKADGCYGLAVDLLKYDSRYAKVFKYIFRDTLVVENLEVAKRIGIGTIRMVTMDGDLIETSGAMKGGYRKKQTSLGFQQEEITRHIQELSALVEKLEQETKKLEDEKTNVEQTIYDLRQKKAELEGEIIKGEKSLHLNSEDIEADKNRKEELKKELKSIESRLMQLSSQIRKSLTELTRLKQQKEKLRLEINQIRNPKILAEMDSYRERLERINNELNEINSRIRENEVRIKEVHGKEAESISQILNQLDNQEKQFKAEINEKKEKLSELNKILKEKEKKAEEFYSKYKELFKLRNKLSDELRKTETAISEINEKIRDIEYKINGLSLDKAAINAQMAGLNEEYEPLKDVPKIENKSINQLKRELDEFARTLENMGNVNLKSLEIYESVKKEYEELVNKKETLLREKDEVLKMMEEIESKKEEMFLKTFNALEKHFSEFFQKLSGKGDAHLILENPNKPMDGGVLIKVKLTSKRYVDIRGLSGGEKTLTVLALIFAIQEFEPATFYVFDEVDAALDKNNSEKLAKLIKEYSKRAQYIVISHNDYIIQNGDTLFGVSMNDEGISKIVSLKV